MSKKGGQARSVYIGVVGLSGLDRDQAFYGVGKSCLCNRFVRPLADEYITEHSSVFSSSDFGGRVLNNDHFLYWGSATKTVEDGGGTFVIHVIEQTEFIDDATLMPLSRGGNLAPYPKRCAISKLSSPQKLMYISRDQVALQNDYEQVSLPGGKTTVDGFLVVYDAEATQSKRLEEQQERLLSTILSYVQKSKKPFALVATKCDDTQLNLLQEVHRFAQSKKLNVPIIETSAHENVNVDLAFVVLAQLIDRGKVRSKLIPFTEAQKTQREYLAKVVQDFQRLIDRTVTDFRAIWKNTKKLVENDREFLTHRDLCGLEACKRLFNKHIKKLKKEFEERKLNGYLSRLPGALDELMPTASSMDLCQWNWQNCQKTLRNHKEFLKWMIVLPEETAWNESDHLLTDDPRVPFDVLLLPQAEQVFQNHTVKLKAEEKRIRMKNEFRKLLELTPKISPGTMWVDAAVLLQNEESFQYLNDADKTQIFDTYRRDITEKAKADFQELLFESAGLFSKLEPNTRPSISQEDMRQIKDALSEDERYKRLDKLDSDREIGLINHIALLYSSTRCLSGAERCRDRLMQEIVTTTTYRPQFVDSSETLASEDNQINLYIIGSGGYTQALESEIRMQCSYGDADGLEFALDGRMYELDYQLVDGDVDLPEYALSGNDVNSQGCFCVYGSEESLDFVRDCLDELSVKSKYDTVDESNPILIPPPTFLILAKNPNNEEIVHQLRKEGQELCARYNATFIDLPVARFSPGKTIHETQVVDAMRGLLESLKQQVRANLSTEDLKDSEPDIKIMLCAMCGDPYPVELILGPLLHHQNCWRSSTRPDTIILETYLGFDKKRVQITLTSYHRAYTLNYQNMYHGYILVYSAIRKASLGTLSGFSGFIPQVPIQVLAVTGSASGASVVFHSNVAASLLADGTNLASKLFAKFQTTSSQFQHQVGAFAAFFNQVWEKKRESEMAYQKFLSEQQLRQAKKQQQVSVRRRHDPLPEPPSKKLTHIEDEINRRRSLNRHQSGSPKHIYQLPKEAMEESDINPYAVFEKETPLPGYSSVEDVKQTNHARDSEGSDDLVPYATSTPTALFLTLQKGGALPGGTPPNNESWQKREIKTEDLYAQVDLSRKRSFRKSKELAMNDSEVNLIENTLYANANLVQQQKSARETPPATLEVPPPIPQRKYNLEEDFPPVDSGTDTLRSNCDEGYNTFRTDDHKEENHYAVVADLQPRPTSVSTEDPYVLRVREKINLFNSKMLPKQDIWVKMDARQEKSKEIYSSVPELNKQGADVEAPLAQQEDVSDPEYAQLQDALKSKASIPQKARPIIHAVAVIEEPKPTLSETKGKMATRSPSRGSLRLAHSAEDVSTLERLSRRDAFGRPVTGRRGKRGEGNTSDQGTGDEATLPRTEERQEKKKKKSGVQRSRSTQRSGLVSTPNVSFDVRKKQLFSGRRSEERRGIGK
ncbi:Rho GTPase-activating protein 5 [Acropora cervicornis]|uniref:Rho GTPase-activating protein 5 n=1 Tax=Acropora cervicornis TaxID=6130 RepID=A0AAD9QVS0_ACRCE|nr:Rho GTPase-activating protein 5 [Acropora cervicornis]